MSAGVQELQIGDIAGRHRTAMHRHVFDHPDHEVGGVIVGELDPRTGRPNVVGVIPALEAIGETASVTFTHEAWEMILERQEEEFPGTQIVGWYHSHPTFGIFLSEADLFIHRNFFGDPHQFAYVVDPIERSEGIFGWRDGEIVLFEDAVGFSTDHLAEPAPPSTEKKKRGVPVKAAPLAIAPVPVPASSGKLTIDLADLDDVEDPVAPEAADGAAAVNGLVVGAPAVAGGSASRVAAPLSGLGAARPAPRGPSDPRAEAARQASRRRRAILAAAASVVLIGGVGIAVATGSGGDGGVVGSGSVTDQETKNKAASNAETQKKAVSRDQDVAISAFAGANQASIDAYKKAHAPTPPGGKANPGGGGSDGPDTGGTGTGGTGGTGTGGNGGTGTGGNGGTGTGGNGGTGTGGTGGTGKGDPNVGNSDGFR